MGVVGSVLGMLMLGFFGGIGFGLARRFGLIGGGR